MKTLIKPTKSTLNRFFVREIKGKSIFGKFKDKEIHKSPNSLNFDLEYFAIHAEGFLLHVFCRFFHQVGYPL